MREVGAPAGRGAYAEAIEVDKTISLARNGVAQLLGAKSSKEVVFTAGCTDALNLAMHGLLKAGDHLVVTAVDHNSVLRPARFLEEHVGVQVSRVPCNAGGVLDPQDVRQAMLPNTRLVCVNHASNVTGMIQPLAEISRLVHETSALLLVDGAQSVGHIAFDVQQLNADLVAISGHKGMLGPSGIGVLYIREGLETQITPQRQGGTGSHSDDDRQPQTMPDRFESGSPNVYGLVGLNDAIKFLMMWGVNNICQHERQLTAKLLAGLQAIPKITVYGSSNTDDRVGVVSVNMEGYDPRELAAMLDLSGIRVRSGIHCAPLMHQALGTLEMGGTVRFSFGLFNTEDEVQAVIDALQAIADA